MIVFWGTNYRIHNTRDRETWGNQFRQIFLSHSSSVFIETCNRKELYFFSGDEPRGSLENIPQRLVGKGAYQHLIEVLVGLDSAIKGETEIIGQVKKSLNDSISRGRCNLQLVKVFEGALRVSKQIRKDCSLSHAGVSYAKSAAKWVQDRLRSRGEGRILLFGAGQMGKAVLRQLVSLNLGKKTTVCSGRGALREEIKDKFGMNCISRELAFQNLEDYEAIITATAAPHPVLKKTHFQGIQKNNRILCDISADLNLEEGVELFFEERRNLDDFIREYENQEGEAFDIPKYRQAYRMIEEHVKSCET